MSSSAFPQAVTGVRLLSNRPSVLAKLVPHLGPDGGGRSDVMGDGLEVTGPDWEERLKSLLETLSVAERAGLFAVSLGDELALPMPSTKVLARKQTEWFPEFLSHGDWVPHFQPIVDFASGKVVGREVLMRGKLGNVELRGEELVTAAEAHDAIYSFDRKARLTALEVGVPLLREDEMLFVNLDPRGVVDMQGSINGTWPVLERLGGKPQSLCIEFVAAERFGDLKMLVELAAVHREQGGSIALDDLSGSAQSLACLEAIKPDVAKLDIALISNLEKSVARRRLVGALVESAHELGTKVVAEGIERVQEFQTVRGLGVDYGQGYYFGHPTEKPLDFDPAIVERPATGTASIAPAGTPGAPAAQPAAPQRRASVAPPGRAPQVAGA